MPQDVDRAQLLSRARPALHVFLSGDDGTGPCRRRVQTGRRDAKSAARLIAGDTVAFAKLDRAKTGAGLSAGKAAHQAARQDRGLPAFLAIATGAQGRRQARPGLGQAGCSRKTLPSLSCTMWETHEVVWWGGGRICICAYHLAADPPRRRHRAMFSRRSAIAKRSARASSSAAATRSSRAVTASSATFASDIKPLPRRAGISFDEKMPLRRRAAALHSAS